MHPCACRWIAGGIEKGDPNCEFLDCSQIGGGSIKICDTNKDLLKIGISVYPLGSTLHPPAVTTLDPRYTSKLVTDKQAMLQHKKGFNRSILAQSATDRDLPTIVSATVHIPLSH